MNSPSGNVPIVLSNHISVKDAAKISGYSVQYIRKLLRAERLQGLKIGQLWLIEASIFEAYWSNNYLREDRRYGPRNSTQRVETLVGFIVYPKD